MCLIFFSFFSLFMFISFCLYLFLSLSRLFYVFCLYSPLFLSFYIYFSLPLSFDLLLSLFPFFLSISLVFLLCCDLLSALLTLTLLLVTLTSFSHLLAMLYCTRLCCALLECRDSGYDACLRIPGTRVRISPPQEIFFGKDFSLSLSSYLLLPLFLSVLILSPSELFHPTPHKAVHVFRERSKRGRRGRRGTRR
uniref:Uncharacterized protein n=1 Tax=Rhipicephalus pulchellus TaxID=72859 RepID=L7LXZ1_RHIPC